MLSFAPFQLSQTLPYGSPLPLYAFFSTSSVIPNLTLRFPITTLRFLQHQFSYPQPYLTVPHYNSTLSSEPVQLSPTLPYCSPLPLYAFFSTISVIPNLTLRFPITTLRFLQHQFSYPQPYLTVPHYHSTLSSAPVQLFPTLPYGSPLPLYAFFSTISVIPNLTLRFPITTLRFLQHQFSYPQPYLTVPHYLSTLSFAPVQLFSTLPYGSPLPLYAFFSTISVIPNLTLRFPITTLRFLQHQFSYPQPYLTVPHHHSTLSSAPVRLPKPYLTVSHHHSKLSSAPVQLSTTLPHGSPSPLYAFFSTSSVIPNLTLRFPITTLRFLQHQFSYPQPYLAVPHYHSTLSSAPVQLSQTLRYGSPLPLYAFFRTSSVIPNLTLRFSITNLRFLQHQFSYPQPYLTVPHYHSTLSSAPVQLSPTLPYGSPSPLYAFFSTSSVTQTLTYGFPLPLYAFFRTISVIPNLTLRFPITTLRFLQHQFSYPQPYLAVPHYHSTLSSAPVQLSLTLPYGSPLPLYAFFRTSSVIPNLTLRFPITTLRFLQHQFSYP